VHPRNDRTWVAMSSTDSEVPCGDKGSAKGPRKRTAAELGCEAAAFGARYGLKFSKACKPRS
jgi:hypothetical protein